MLCLLSIVAMITATTALAADLPFYIGTYTGKSGSQGIYAGSIDSETGKLGPIRLAAEAVNPSFLALSPDGAHLYAAMEEKGGAVGAFKVGKDGSLTLLHRRESGGNGACHVSVDPSGRCVFVANYGSGSIASFPIVADGSLGERASFIQLTGSGPNASRQKSPHAHAIYADAASRFVYVCDLGTDKVWIYALDPATGALTPVEPASASVPAGGGPRHLALHPGGHFAYANNEMGNSVTAFARNPATGVLSPLQTLPTLPLEANGLNFSTAEIFCHPTGKWLYVSNRGHDSIAVFAIAEDGRLTFLEAPPAGVKTPRGFAIDPSGRWLVVGGQDDHRITVLKIDPATGRLTATSESAEVGAPVCVVFAPQRE